MSDELALTMRPRSFNEMVGSKKLLHQIRKIMEGDKIPKAWMFSGDTGAGKTTIARIMAVSLQCRHQEFGDPCKRCIRHKREFDIVEINASDITGIEGMRDAVSGAFNYPKPGSRRRVYILDEFHQASQHTQNLLLKFFEDCPRTTNWIVCTTRPDKILPTLQSRCTILAVPSLDLDGVKQLVKRGLKICHSDRSVSELSEKLLENRITSPRLILKAVQKYVDEETTADEAAQVTLVSDVDTYTICRTIVKGDWESIAKLLTEAKPEDNMVIRKSVAGYLNTMLLGDVVGDRANNIAKVILQLNVVGDDMAATCAVLYNACKYFSRETK
jgi:DNA polymerase III subunit gamma/tau